MNGLVSTEWLLRPPHPTKMQQRGQMNWGSASKAAGNCHISHLTLPFSLIGLDRCQQMSKGSRNEAAEWYVLIDSPYKERNFGLSAWKAVPPSLLFSNFFKLKQEKKTKKVRPRSHLQKCGVGARVLVRGVLTFAVVAHPPETVPAFALVGAWRVVAGGIAAAVAPA